MNHESNSKFISIFNFVSQIYDHASKHIYCTLEIFKYMIYSCKKLMLRICIYHARGREIPNFFGGDARRKISMELLRGTNLGVAQVDFKP